MTIREAIIETINDNFRDICTKREKNSLLNNVFNSHINGSANMHLLPSVSSIELKTIDETHDNITLLYDDYRIDGVITWKPSIYMKEHFIFVKLQ